jgi:hypothetical protein
MWSPKKNTNIKGKNEDIENYKNTKPGFRRKLTLKYTLRPRKRINDLMKHQQLPWTWKGTDPGFQTLKAYKNASEPKVQWDYSGWVCQSSTTVLAWGTGLWEHYKEPVLIKFLKQKKKLFKSSSRSIKGEAKKQFII